MKRSEILKHIADIIDNEFNLKNGEYLSHVYAIVLLDLIEDMGMQPPRDPVLLTNRWEKE